MRFLKFIAGITLIIGSQSAFSQLKVKPDGYVGIGTNNPVTRLHVYGEGLIDSYTGSWGRAFWTRVHYKNASAYNLWNSYYDKDVFFVNGEGWLWSRLGAYVGSDSAVMENISPILSPLVSVMQLNGVRYSFKDDSAERADRPYRLGLVAQDLEKVVPESVRTMEDRLKAVAYADLVPLLIEAMKEQQLQIESLQATLTEQGEEISRIKNKRWFRKRLE